MAADDVAFTGDALANGQMFDFAAQLFDGADIFVADDHGDGNGFLRPFIPFVNVQIGAADGGFFDLDQNVIRADGRDRGVLHPDAGFGFQFYE